MASDKDIKDKIKLLEGNNAGLIKQVKELEGANKKLASDNETNKGLAEQLKVATDKVKTLTGQNETLAKKAGKVVGPFPKITGFKRVDVVGEVQLTEDSVVTMHRVETKNSGSAILHVTSKDGKGESALLTPIK